MKYNKKLEIGRLVQAVNGSIFLIIYNGCKLKVDDNRFIIVEQDLTFLLNKTQLYQFSDSDIHSIDSFNSDNFRKFYEKGI